MVRTVGIHLEGDTDMYATVGDRLVAPITHGEGSVRDGEILEVLHADGSPPYRVRWSDDGREALVFHGPDAHVQHFDHSFKETTQ
jgi:hypothetical protein